MTDGLRDVSLCFLGFGNVARAFCALLDQQKRVLADVHGLRVVITGVGDLLGSLLARDGLEPAAVLAAVPRGGRFPDPPRPADEVLRSSEADVLVELTVIEPGSAPVSTAHIETAFDLGMDVVTANKGPIAWNWDRIAAKSAATGRRIRFETTVMDGLPVFSLLEYTLMDCRLSGFEAVFNSTTNFIIDAITGGESFDRALKHAREEGFAEADPSHDLDGWDAAYKAAALANVAMDAGITPEDVDRRSLRDVPLERIQQAHVDGKRLRLVTSVWRDEAGPVLARIRATELDIDHPLAPLTRESLGVVLHTDLMGDVVIAEMGPLLPQTAYGVYADLLHLCRID